MIIFDLDGTLANYDHRRHFLTPPKNYKFIYTDSVPHGDGCILTGHWEYEDGKKWEPDWTSFYEACDKDTPIYPVVNIFKCIRCSALSSEPISIWSGRCSSVREKTKYWLDINGILYNDLKMRPIGDNTPDDILKESWLDEAISQEKTIELVFDDRKKVIEMWRRRGIFLFDVSQGKGDF